MNRPCERMKEIVCTAAELKNMKKALYARALACGGDGSEAEVFRFLHDVEDKLLSTFLGNISQVEGGPKSVEMDCSFAIEGGEPALWSALSAWSCQAGISPETILAIENGIRLGHVSMRFCTISLGETESPAEREFLAALLAEEQEQVNLLCSLKSFFANPANDAASTSACACRMLDVGY
jgi:hypothetical protein